MLIVAGLSSEGIRIIRLTVEEADRLIQASRTPSTTKTLLLPAFMYYGEKIIRTINRIDPTWKTNIPRILLWLIRSIPTTATAHAHVARRRTPLRDKQENPHRPCFSYRTSPEGASLPTLPTLRRNRSTWQGRGHADR